VKSFGKRLNSGADLLGSIEEMVEHYNIAAGALLSADGILSRAELKTTNGVTYAQDGQFIINSCTGTAALDAVHLEMNLTTTTGEIVIGELLEGCVVADTVDLVIGAVESTTR
jgi:predicted DNA-binding protein with PD1-like motif